MMIKIIFFALLSLPVFAQTLPQQIELSGDEYKQLKTAQRDLRNAQLEVENLQLKIEQAQRQLTDLQRKSSEELQRWQTTMTRLTKVPADKLNEYTFIEKGDKFIISYSGPRK